MQGVFLDSASLDMGDIDFSPLRSVLPAWRFFEQTEPSQVCERIAGAEIVVSNKVVLDAESIASADRLHLICVAATGTNNIDLDAARRAGIPVSNVQKYATPSVVQHVFALILGLTTRLNDYQRAVHAGRWQESPRFCLLDYPIREIAGKVLGIVGYGELGHGVARVAEAFGLEVRVSQRAGASGREPGRWSLRELLPTVDILSLHVPLTDETRHLIGSEELALMKNDALLINTARGGIVDEQALANALRAGQLGGAGIDVLTEEPPRHGNPLLADDIPNLILTPHVAWASRESRQRMVVEVAENIRAFLAGAPRNAVV
jgi:glycerate dehydrogenase